MSKKHLGKRLLVPLFIGGALLGLLGSWITYVDAVSHHREEFAHRGQVLAGAIAGLVNATEGKSQQFFVDLRIAIEEFVTLEPSVLEVMVATSDPFIILVSTAHTDLSTTESSENSLAVVRRSIDEGKFGLSFDAVGDLTVLLPIRPRDIEIGENIEPASTIPQPGGSHELYYDPADYRGTILLKLDWSSVREASTIILWQAVAVNLVTILLLFGLAYLLLKRMVLKPMATIRSTLQQQEGKQSSARVPPLVDDEIGSVAESLNLMLDAIEERDLRLKQSRDELEVIVDERTSELRATSAELVRRERLATLGQLSSTVSHELRNPLGTIRNSLFTIARRSRDSTLDLEQTLERANSGIERCNTIIGELLDYASDKTPVKHAASIDDWLESVLDESSLPETVELRRDLSSNATIEFNPDALRQVVQNLVDNACQAMTDEQTATDPKPVLEVTTGIEGDFAILTFSDTGPGIPPESREKVFEPLYSTKTFGVGLGLPLVKKIVEQHEGSIEIDSPDATGVRFTLRFPMVNSARR